MQSLTNQQVTVLKAIIFALLMMPFLRLIAATALNRLGANPVEFLTRNTGDWTLYCLTLGLSITPVRRLLQWHWLLRMRRMLGLYAFFYASLHFLTFLWFDHFFDLDEMWRDVIKRPFITVGFIAFVCLIPLAATSTNAMVKRLGGKRWQWLHRLVYLIVTLGILHFWWMKAGKHDFSQPSLFLGLTSILLLARLVHAAKQRGWAKWGGGVVWRQ